MTCGSIPGITSRSPSFPTPTAITSACTGRSSSRPSRPGSCTPGCPTRNARNTDSISARPPPTSARACASPSTLPGTSPAARNPSSKARRKAASSTPAISSCGPGFPPRRPSGSRPIRSSWKRLSACRVSGFRRPRKCSPASSNSARKPSRRTWCRCCSGIHSARARRSSWRSIRPGCPRCSTGRSTA